MTSTSHYIPCLYCQSPNAYKQYDHDTKRYQIHCPVCQTSIPLAHYAQLAKEQKDNSNNK